MRIRTYLKEGMGNNSVSQVQNLIFPSDLELQCPIYLLTITAVLLIMCKVNLKHNNLIFYQSQKETIEFACYVMIFVVPTDQFGCRENIGSKISYPSLL